VRRAILSAALLCVALMLQLTVVNRLPLPGSGAPNLVLLTVVALGLSGGPAAGAVTGFCAGLGLDIAPPGSYLIGQYALVFCLVGYLCGRLRGVLNRSALLTITVAMAIAAAGEALSAAFGLAVSNPQVTWPAVQQVLPSSVIYDAVLAPFVLYLVARAMRLADGLGRGIAAAGQPADGSALLARTQAAGGALPRGSLNGAAALGGAGLLGGAGWVSGPMGSRRSRGPRAPRSGNRAGATPRVPRTPRLREAAARHGDGWLGSAPRTGLPAPPRMHPGRPGRTPRFRPGAGSPGSAVARPAPPLPRPEVNLRLGAAGRRYDRSVGRALSTGGRALGAGLGAGAGSAAWRGRARSGPPGSAFRARRPGAGGPAALARPGAVGRKALGRGAFSQSSRFRPDPRLRGGSARSEARLSGGTPGVRPSRRVSLRLGSARRYDGVLGGGVLGRRAPRGGALGSRGLRASALRGSGLAGGGLRAGGLRAGGPRAGGLRAGGLRGSRLRAGGLRGRALRGGGLRGGAGGGVPGSGRGLAARPASLRLGSGRRGSALGGLQGRRRPRLGAARRAAPRFRSAVLADGYLTFGRRTRPRAGKRVRFTSGGSSFLATWTGGLLGGRPAARRIGKRTGGLR